MADERIDVAVSLFGSGFNCAQAVFAAFAEGIDRETALRLATGFGGGLGRQGETCGAVSGAILAIGLKEGRSNLAGLAARDRTYCLVTEFVRQFRVRHGSLACRDLLGLDLALPGQFELAVSRGLFRTRCPELVGSAAEILAGMPPHVGDSDSSCRPEA